MLATFGLIQNLHQLFTGFRPCEFLTGFGFPDSLSVMIKSFPNAQNISIYLQLTGLVNIHIQQKKSNRAFSMHYLFNNMYQACASCKMFDYVSVSTSREAMAKFLDLCRKTGR